MEKYVVEMLVKGEWKVWARYELKDEYNAKAE